MCVTVIGISAVRFCNIHRPCCASMTAGDAASYYFFIASTVGKMSSLISTPLNGVITGHLARYQGKITKKMLTGVFAALSALAVILIAGTTLVLSFTYISF